MRHAPTGSEPVPRLEVGQYSHPGQKRTNNEDWLGTYQPESSASLAARGSLFLVADGMGGHQGGEVASRYAVDQVIRHFAHHATHDAQASLRKAIESANDLLYRQGENGPSARHSGTTLVAALVRGRELWIANVGDSRAYLLRKERLEQISRDHTWGGEKGKALGANWVGRHVITRALGTKAEVEVDVYPPVALAHGDRVVLCSDGLTCALNDQEIGEIAGRHAPQEAAEQLIRAANQKGAADNVSVILIGVNDTGAGQTPIGRLKAVLTESGGIDEIVTALTGDRQLLVLAIGALLLSMLVIVGLGFVAGLLMW